MCAHPFHLLTWCLDLAFVKHRRKKNSLIITYKKLLTNPFPRCGRPIKELSWKRMRRKKPGSFYDSVEALTFGGAPVASNFLHLSF